MYVNESILQIGILFYIKPNSNWVDFTSENLHLNVIGTGKSTRELGIPLEIRDDWENAKR